MTAPHKDPPRMRRILVRELISMILQAALGLVMVAVALYLTVRYFTG
jgi:hypothetical protein